MLYGSSLYVSLLLGTWPTLYQSGIPSYAEIGRKMNHNWPHLDRAEPGIACSDGLGRQRQIDTWVRPRGTRVILRVPPGEIALLTADEARGLIAQLTDLAKRIDRPSPPVQ